MSSTNDNIMICSSQNIKFSMDYRSPNKMTYFGNFEKDLELNKSDKDNKISVYFNQNNSILFLNKNKSILEVYDIRNPK